MIDDVHGRLYCSYCRKETRKIKDQVSYKKHAKTRKALRKAYYEKNKERVYDANKKWRSKNLSKVKLYRHSRDERLKLAYKDGSVNPENIESLLKFQENECNICFCDIKNSYTIDHIVPLSKKGDHAIYNIQLLCFSCNSRKQAKMSEQDIQYTILQYLKLKKIFAFKHNNAGIKKQNGSYIPVGLKGVSDILGCLPDGRFLAIECKSSSGVTTEAQAAFIELIRKSHGVAFIARSVDDVIRELDSL